MTKDDSKEWLEIEDADLVHCLEARENVELYRTGVSLALAGITQVCNRVSSPRGYVLKE